jgi:hypothetical protein
VTEHESREEIGRRLLEEELREGFRPFRRRGSVRITVVDDEHGRDVEVDDEHGRPEGYDAPERR